MALKTLDEAMRVARQLAEQFNTRFYVWEHCGDYGNPDGDIPATHEYRVTRWADETRVWALVGFVEPDKDDG